MSGEPAEGRSAAATARRLVETLGGRYSAQLGISVDQGPDEVERWFLAATLFGHRISAEVAMRTYRAIERAGIRTIAEAAGARGDRKPRFDHAAAAWYSWMSPPSRSSRRTSRVLTGTGTGTQASASGEARPRARWGRAQL
jgi:hypothetical protein